MSDSSKHIDTLYLTGAERDQLLMEVNDTRRDYPQHLCIHQLFEAQAEKTPEAAAVIFREEEVGYRGLNQRANQLAHYLRALGVGPEAVVGLCLERSVEMVVSLLAVLKAGGAYLPLDPAYPEERLRFIAGDAKVAALVTQQRLIGRLPGDVGRLVCVDTEGEAIGKESAENPDSGVRADNLAYVIYTSGSTGRPKGVLITHRALVNHNLAVAQRFNLQPTDRILQFASLSFDVAAEEMFPSWLSGAAVVLRPDTLVPSMTGFISELEGAQVTVLNLPTPYWHEWVEHLGQADAPWPGSLRLLIIGSERASPERLATWLERVGARLPLLNAYGLTETTITSLIYQPPLSPRAWPASAEVPLGRPIANTQVYVLDSELRPMPVGVPGELHLGGAGLARGYLNRPELTAERFMPNLFSDEDGARLYKTGDLVRFLPEGDIEFLSRIDQQVKLRGFRIELGEVEKVLSRHPAVQESVVVAREQASGDKRLVAYVVAQQEAAPTPRELRSYLKEQLPGYMVPAAFVLLEKLPLTPNGKIDRRGLPAPDPEGSRLEEDFIEPRSPVEEAMAGIWAQVLGLERVGVEENFFELGGHSLLATQVISRVREAFQVELPVRHFFEMPTVASLAPVIARLQAEQEEDRKALILKILEEFSEDELDAELNLRLHGERKRAHDE